MRAGFLWLALLLAAGPAASQTSDDDPGSAERPASKATGAAAGPRYGVDHLLIEAGGFPSSDQADYSLTLRAAAFVSWRPSAAWELRAGGQVNGVTQQGGVADYTQWQGLFTDTFVRWRSGVTRLTFGEQTIIWGRVDAVPLIDRVSRMDLTRFGIDDLRERRLADLALRWEQTVDDVKLDAVVLPLCRCALLPDTKSVWSPVNPVSGRVIGIAPSPQIEALVRNAVISDDTSGFGGGGARLTATGGAIDWGLTLARTRQSAPYYLADASVPALTGIHPFNDFAGVDAEWATSDLTWRAELGYTGGVPVTLPGGAMAMAGAVGFVGGVEFFPGGKDTRVNLQVAAQALRTGQTILELKDYLGINGAVESSFAQGRWKAGLKFSVGLNVNDLYLAPSISYVGWEPYEVYLAAYYFAGEAQTYGGFFENQNMVALGLRKRF